MEAGCEARFHFFLPEADASGTAVALSTAAVCQICAVKSKGLSRVFSNTTVQKHQFFGAQPSSQSNSHIHT